MFFPCLVLLLPISLNMPLDVLPRSGVVGGRSTRPWKMPWMLSIGCQVNVFCMVQRGIVILCRQKSSWEFKALPGKLETWVLWNECQHLRQPCGSCSRGSRSTISPKPQWLWPPTTSSASAFQNLSMTCHRLVICFRMTPVDICWEKSSWLGREHLWNHPALTGTPCWLAVRSIINSLYNVSMTLAFYNSHNIQRMRLVCFLCIKVMGNESGWSLTQGLPMQCLENHLEWTCVQAKASAGSSASCPLRPLRVPKPSWMSCRVWIFLSGSATWRTVSIGWNNLDGWRNIFVSNLLGLTG